MVYLLWKEDKITRAARIMMQELQNEKFLPKAGILGHCTQTSKAMGSSWLGPTIRWDIYCHWNWSLFQNGIAQPSGSDVQCMLEIVLLQTLCYWLIVVKRLWRRQYDPGIIEKTIGLVLGPSTAMYRLFLKHCTLTNKAVGTTWQTLYKPPQRP